MGGDQSFDINVRNKKHITNASLSRIIIFFLLFATWTKSPSEQYKMYLQLASWLIPARVCCVLPRSRHSML